MTISITPCNLNGLLSGSSLTLGNSLTTAWLLGQPFGLEIFHSRQMFCMSHYFSDSLPPMIVISASASTRPRVSMPSTVTWAQCRLLPSSSLTHSATWSLTLATALFLGCLAVWRNMAIHTTVIASSLKLSAFVLNSTLLKLRKLLHGDLQCWFFSAGLCNESFLYCTCFRSSSLHSSQQDRDLDKLEHKIQPVP